MEQVRSGREVALGDPVVVQLGRLLVLEEVGEAGREASLPTAITTQGSSAPTAPPSTGSPTACGRTTLLA